MVILEIFDKSHPGFAGLADGLVGRRVPSASDSNANSVKSRKREACATPGLGALGVEVVALVEPAALRSAYGAEGCTNDFSRAMYGAAESENILLLRGRACAAVAARAADSSAAARACKGVLPLAGRVPD